MGKKNKIKNKKNCSFRFDFFFLNMLFGVFEAGTHVSCPDWPQICYTVKDDLKFLIFLLLPPKDCNCRHLPPP